VAEGAEKVANEICAKIGVPLAEPLPKINCQGEAKSRSLIIY
jgi:hypothetical protein